MKAWLNGTIVEQDSILVSPLSQSFSRGTALFEVLEVVKSHRGPAIFGLKEHLDRLFNSARLTFMELPDSASRDTLTAAVMGVLSANGIDSGIVKIFLYYPVPEYACVPSDRRVDAAVFCARMDHRGDGHAVRACVSSYRKLDPETVPVHAKSAGNYINAYLALSDAKRRGFDESILLDTGGFVAEGSTSNIFIVKRGAVMTPTLRSILPGITRMFILDILKGVLECAEVDITAGELKTADEAFFSNSVERVMPVLSIDDTPLRSPCPGPVTKRVIREIASVIGGSNPAYARWLTPVA